MKKLLPFLLFSLFTFSFLSCESDNFEILKDRETNSITVKSSGETKTETFTNVEITNDELLLPESVSEINKFNSQISVKTAAPKQNVYLNRIYCGKTPLSVKGLAEGFYELSIEYVNTEDALKNNKIIKKNYLIEVKYGEAQNYYFAD